MDLKIALEKKDINWVRDFSKSIPISQIADEVEKLSIVNRVLFFRMLNTDVAGEIFSSLEMEVQENLIKNFSDEMVEQILDELYTDEIADLIEEIPSNLSQRVLKNIDPERRTAVNKILKYKEDQIGSIMSVDIISLKENWTAQQAIEYIRNKKDDVELTHYYYIVNKNKKLVGALTLEDIVFSKDNLQLKEIMFAVPCVYTTDLKEDVANVFAENDMSVIPVMNSSNRLIGMVTSDDIIDIVQEEGTEDMYKMAGINSEDLEEQYLKTSILKIVKSRIFWLIVLMFGSTLSQVIIQIFTDYLEHSNSLKSLGMGIFISTIISIIPVISGSAGNAGSQSATTITRALSLGEIKKRGYMKKVFFKELNISMVIGSILMLINFIRLICYFMISRDLFNTSFIEYEGQITKLPKYAYILIISAAASISMFLVIVFSKILGSVIPLLAARIGKDPAVMSAPVLATLTDATSTLIFFGITILIFLVI
ncbi:magnesium transporter [Mesomycoplasma lagogenitalium]|uniref:Magnesium transporter MgtE n=1 Tax=Mesomycoplasma lagogenitalium TaxID=171286 RepID=A0ABY8LWW9_9BACT|nr:magnesium transporter [Mesomycoplasma lagogenitalium]WGI36813.1 magnesium transporter [Mesomycoplasma lagogenitalium]